MLCRPEISVACDILRDPVQDLLMDLQVPLLEPLRQVDPLFGEMDGDAPAVCGIDDPLQVTALFQRGEDPVRRLPLSVVRSTSVFTGSERSPSECTDAAELRNMDL
jgi:hypothetical protein